MTYYRKHLFFCTNRRSRGSDRPSCDLCGATELRAWAKARVQELGLTGPDGVRVNTSGCLDRCEEGPCLVIYPEGIWYTYVDEGDLEEIIQTHVVEGCVVGRLRIDPSADF